jgi:hypothetical protein
MPAPEIVECPGGDFFARASFPKKENVGIGLGKGLKRSSQALYWGGATDKPPRHGILPTRMRLEHPVLEDQAPMCGCAPDRFDQANGISRFFNEIPCSSAHGFNRHGHIAMTGDQYDGNFAIYRQDRIKKTEPV